MPGTSSRFVPAVNVLLDAHDHPLRKEIDALRTIILAVDECIEEGVKWIAASFRTTDRFATLNGPKHVKEPMLILHADAKAKGIVLDRGLIVFADLTDINRKQKALRGILRAWIELI